jgi:hypothetical protein
MERDCADTMSKHARRVCFGVWKDRPTEFFFALISGFFLHRLGRSVVLAAADGVASLDATKKTGIDAVVAAAVLVGW